MFTNLIQFKAERGDAERTKKAKNQLFWGLTYDNHWVKYPYSSIPKSIYWRK